MDLKCFIVLKVHEFVSIGTNEPDKFQSKFFQGRDSRIKIPVLKPLPNNSKAIPTTEIPGQLWHSTPTHKDIQLYLIFIISLIHALFRCLTTFSLLLFCIIPIKSHYISFVQSNLNSRYRGYHHLGIAQGSSSGFGGQILHSTNQICRNCYVYHLWIWQV